MALDLARVAPSEIDQLDVELQASLDASQPCPDHRQQVDQCLTDLRTILHADVADPQPWQVAAFGSSVNGFVSRGGDIDVVAYQMLQDRSSLSDARTVLKKLKLAFSKQTTFIVKEALLHDRVRVPILKLRYAGKYDVDLSVNNISPLPNTRLLRRYGSLDRRVAELGVIIKMWAKNSGLCGAPNGYLSSYSFILMVIYFLQVTDVGMPCLQRNGDLFDDDGATKICSQELVDGWVMRETLAALIRAFFKFYASDFRWGREVVSIRLGRRVNSEATEFQLLSKRRDKRIHIEDPFIPERNLNDVLGGFGENDLWEGIRAADAFLDEGKFSEVLLSASSAPGSPERGWRGKSRGSWRRPTTYYPRWDTVKGSGYAANGHKLPRKRISTEHASGTVTGWHGKYGWIRPDTLVEHDGRQHSEDIFISMADISGRASLPVGHSCRFHIFCDERGLGADDCVLFE